MRETLLSFLSCPECGSGFDLTVLVKEDDRIIEGLLHCVATRHVYPVVRAVPRILASAFGQEPQFTAKHRALIATYRSVASTPTEPEIEQTKKGFGRQWTTYQVQRSDEDLAYFQSKTGVTPSYLNGRLVLDARCGSGRYAEVAGEAGAVVVGVDLSAAVETAASSTSHLPNVHIVQSDIFRLPFKAQAFDFIYSIGVLHHTPNTKQALSSLIPLLTDSGEIAIWLYPRWPAPVELYNQMLRAVTTRMSHEMLHRVAVSMEPIGLLKLKLLTSSQSWKRVLGQLLRGVTIGVSYHPDREIRICDTFDWFSPPYQWHHTDTEVESWLREFGFSQIVNLSKGQSHFQYNYGNGVNFKAGRIALTNRSMS